MLHLDVGRLVVGRPLIAVTIDPRRSQARFSCAVYIVKRVVSDVQRFGSAGTAGIDRSVEYRAIRFCRTCHHSVHVAVEQIVNPNAFQIGIAVRQGYQREAPAQGHECGSGLREYVDVVANLIEHGERFVDQEVTIASGDRDLHQHRVAQKGQIVRLVRVPLGDL